MKLAHILDVDELAKIVELRAKAICQPVKFFVERAGFSMAQWERGGDFDMLMKVLREVGVEVHAVDGGAQLPFQSRATLRTGASALRAACSIIILRRADMAKRSGKRPGVPPSWSI